MDSTFSFSNTTSTQTHIGQPSFRRRSASKLPPPSSSTFDTTAEHLSSMSGSQGMSNLSAGPTRPQAISERDLQVTSGSPTAPSSYGSTAPSLYPDTSVDSSTPSTSAYDPPTPTSSDQRRSSIPNHLREWKRESVSRRSSMDSDMSLAEEGEATPLMAKRNEEHSEQKWYQGPLFAAGVKLSLLFVVFAVVVAGTFYYGMPALDPEDRPVMKLPRSFADLQALNSLFQKYKREYPYRLLACGMVSYLFVQTFSLPGSMYISILFGAAYGLLWGLFLSCLCDSIGSVLCYTVSSLLAPPLLAIPFYRAKVETWRIKIMGDPNSGKAVSWHDIFAFLLILRISPFPPHWVCNCVAPHLGIGVGLFWTAAFFGIIPISVIHVTIGSSLDSMTSAADFHILSARNVFGLVAVVVAVLIPVGLKRVFKQDLGDLNAAESALAAQSVENIDIVVPAVHPIGGSDRATGRRYHALDSGMDLAGPSAGDENLNLAPTPRGKGKGKTVEIFANIVEEEEVGYQVRVKPAGKGVRGYGATDVYRPVQRNEV